MTRKKYADEQRHDLLHEEMIRNRRSIAPGHWSNSDIDCLLRRLDEARSQCDTLAAEARRQAIEECVRLCGAPSRAFEETVAAEIDAAALSCVSIVRRELRIVEKAIRTLLPPVSEERGP